MKHEQALLVALAYVIGFTTAFIAFALNVEDYRADKSPRTPKETRVQRAAASQPVQVVDREEGLFMVKDGRERILSAKATQGNSGDGFHDIVAHASVSPGGGYIHYCAEVSLSPGSCRHFVYSVAEDIVYKVKDQGVPLATANSEAASAAWTADEALGFGGRLADHRSGWHLR